MGRVERRIFVTLPGKRVGIPVESVKIDTGADWTTIPYADACALGLDRTKHVPAVAGSLGARVVGYRMRVRVRLQDAAGKVVKQATVNAFVPYKKVDDRSGRPVGKPLAGRYLVGHDFLQATGSKLDFRKHGNELSGVEIQMGGTRSRITPVEARALRQAVCGRSRRKLRPAPHG